MKTGRLLHSTLRLLPVFLACLHFVALGAEPRPNVILILADDFGYECVGANGGTSYKTPVLDKMAAGGVRFEHCYVQPLCTPTRVQLMTGLYNIRNYTTFGHMDPRCRTFANVLKAAGYRTCITGKWQLGRDRNLPAKFGFDESYLWQHTRRPPRYANAGLEFNGVEMNYNRGEYGPDIINDKAIEFVEKNREQPFFLYYTMMLTHAPYQPTPDSADWDPKAQGEKINRNDRHFGEMTEYMDKLIGKLIARVERLGIADHTLVIFVGDNGTGKGIESRMKDGVVEGGKGSTTANGMRVPLIASWPGKIGSGKVVSDLVDSTDFLPTVCEAAAVPVPGGLDGRSFFPQLCGKTGQPRDWCYCWYSPRGQPPQEFTFTPQYKLTRDGSFFEFGYGADSKPLEGAALAAVPKAVREKLEAGLQRFKNARSAELDRVGAEQRKKDSADE